MTLHHAQEAIEKISNGPHDMREDSSKVCQSPERLHPVSVQQPGGLSHHVPHRGPGPCIPKQTCSFGGVRNKSLLQYLEVTLQACQLQNVISLHCLVYEFLLDYVSKKEILLSLQARIHLLSGSHYLTYHRGSECVPYQPCHHLPMAEIYLWFNSTDPTQHHFCHDEHCSVSQWGLCMASLDAFVPR